MTIGRAYVGTSGWSYTTWRPRFYPEGTKTKDFLPYYATKFSTIEINYTFNHLPTEKNVAQWTAATRADFAYVRRRAREGYSDDAVDVWAKRLGAMRDAGKDVYAYFRHDDDGSNALSALRLRDALA